MNELDGFKNWDKVIVPETAYERAVKSIALSKACFSTMDNLGFRGIFRVNNFRRSYGKTNAEVLEGLAAKLPTTLRLIAGFSRCGDARFEGLTVTLLGFIRDKDNNLVIKIDSPSRVSKR